MRMEETLPKYNEDHIAGKGDSSLQPYNMVHKLLPMPQSIKNSRCDGSSGERIEKIGEKSGMAADESQKQERSDQWSKD